VSGVCRKRTTREARGREKGEEMAEEGQTHPDRRGAKGLAEGGDGMKAKVQTMTVRERYQGREENLEVWGVLRQAGGGSLG